MLHEAQNKVLFPHVPLLRTARGSLTDGAPPAVLGATEVAGVATTDDAGVVVVGKASMFGLSSATYFSTFVIRSIAKNGVRMIDWQAVTWQRNASIKEHSAPI